MPEPDRREAAAAGDASRLWSFATEFYAVAGVADACLALQERHDVDVTLLLCGCWLSAERRGLDAGTAQALAARTARWRLEVVAALRRVRRSLRAAAPVGGEGSETLRTEVARLELAAERVSLDAMAAIAATASGADHDAEAILGLLLSKPALLAPPLRAVLDALRSYAAARMRNSAEKEVNHI